MDAARWERVKAVFSAALEQASATRKSYVARVCADDPELHTEVLSLLDAHEGSGDFIERPAMQQVLGLEPDPPPARSWIGRRVGAYRIVSEIGRGGMSEVFKAVRADDEYHKEVAIKILRAGDDTRSLITLFKTEKRILARLDHPNIARILDGGSTDEGIPYLVMDYIRGRPIDEYARDLPLRQQLELFRTLCSAVQYVHQHLMVHGDLKGNNVLVTDEGSVRLLDFGIARLVGAAAQPDAPDALVPIALTPEYASPERLRGEIVSTASDVYSLGVMLYRLVTGRLPLGDRGAKLPAAGRKPLPPSQTVEATTAAATRIRRQLTGDLDAIVMLALHEDPACRYPSAERLNEDIGRYLQGFPVTARTQGVAHKIRKFCGRHRGGIAAFSLLVLTLIGGVVAASRQAHIARQERARAERHFADVRKLANTFMFDIYEAIQNLPGATAARHILVLNSLKYLDGLSAESAGDPALLRELATAYEKVADVQGGYRQANLGDMHGAIQSYRKALAIRLSLLPVQPEDLDLRRELLRSYGKLGEVLSGSADSAGAIDTSRRALQIAEELANMSGATRNDQRNLGSVYVSLGWQIAKTNEVERGLLLLNQGTAVFETLVDSDPNDIRSRHHQAVAYGRMGEVLIGVRRYDDALRIHTQQHQVAHALSLSDPTNAELQTIDAYALLGIGGVLYRQGHLREALGKQTQAMSTLRPLFDADAKDTDARYGAAFALSEVSETLLTLGELREAELKLRDALAILEPAAGSGDPGMSEARVLQGLDYFRLGKVTARQTSDRAASRAERQSKCEEAQRLFALSGPILDTAEREGQYQPLENRSAQIEKHLGACAQPRT